MEKKKETDVEKLLSKLEFSPENCIMAAALNPLLFRDASEIRMRCLRARSAAKMALEVEQATEELKIRKAARDLGEKTTEASVAAQLLTDEDVQERRREFDEADAMDEYSKLVVEAIRMRRDALRVIGDLVRDEVSVQRAAEATAGKIQETRRKLRERFPGGK